MTVKRLFDLTVALPALALLSPLLLVVALLVRLDSPGPIFFRQERVGWKGRSFRILKFRTMKHTVRFAGAKITVAGDERVTKFGSLLRTWKLDELPQLVNVLLGEMSLVGPRPEVPEYVALYTDEQLRVLTVRPGITDPASLEFRDESELLAASRDPEATYVERVMPTKLGLNLRYIEQQSLLFDLRVLTATLAAVFRLERITSWKWSELPADQKF